MRCEGMTNLEKGSIVVSDLVKTFKGNVTAVAGVSFEVANGECFAFLGPNGAGKSTTIQILTTLLSPTSGEAYVSGLDVRKDAARIRREMGVALQETGIDPMLTGRELLTLQAKLFGFSRHDAKKRADELLEMINLINDADRAIGKYSGGMRRRLDLALSLVHRPTILFLDEPTTGLDPFNRIAIWDEIRMLNREFGTTLFLTTQYLEEADQLAKRICIIDQGRIVASGTPQELKKSIGMDVIELQFEHADVAGKAEGILGELVKQSRRSGDQLTVYVDNGTRALPEIVRLLDQQEMALVSLNLSPPTLDDVFLQVTGNRLDSDGSAMEGGVSNGVSA